jgi:hypothetical protein
MGRPMWEKRALRARSVPRVETGLGRSKVDSGINEFTAGAAGETLERKKVGAEGKIQDAGY